MTVDDKNVAQLAAGFVGNDDELGADFHLEMDSVCHLALQLSTDLDYSNWMTKAAARWTDKFNYTLQSDMKQEEFSKFNLTVNMRSDPVASFDDGEEEMRQWIVNLQLDVTDVTQLYDHRLSYRSLHRHANYTFWTHHSMESDERVARMGVQWLPSRPPLEASAIFRTLSRRVGNLTAVLVTPWTDQPTLEANVHLDARKSPVKVEAVVKAASDSLTAVVNADFIHMLDMNGQVNGTFQRNILFEFLANMRQLSRRFEVIFNRFPFNVKEI